MIMRANEIYYKSWSLSASKGYKFILLFYGPILMW
jgi:hypothetical protein